MDFHSEPSNSWGLSGCASHPSTPRVPQRAQFHRTAGTRNPAMRRFRLQMPETDQIFQNTYWKKNFHNSLSHVYIYICTYIHRISYIIHISWNFTVYVDISWLIISYHHVSLSLAPTFADRRRSAVEPPPASITKASWNPVSFSRTVSAVCRAKQTRQGTVGNRGETGEVPSG